MEELALIKQARDLAGTVLPDVTDVSPGQELYFVNAGQQQVMAVDVTTTPVFQVGTPRLLFRLTRVVSGRESKNVSRDGQRFVFIMPVAPGTPAP